MRWDRISVLIDRMKDDLTRQGYKLLRGHYLGMNSWFIQVL